ncbi:MAG: PIG-L family deacetylase [Bacteroidales bacterium]|nr:PIG-L family deacetylase [Bacteroidales bacterium]
MATEFNKVALSINAHPDDAEAWNAGVLKFLHDRGYRIVIATMTGGDLGGCNMSMEETARVRYDEAKAAAAVLDAEYYTMGATNGSLYRHAGAAAEDNITNAKGEGRHRLYTPAKRLPSGPPGHRRPSWRPQPW